MTIQGLDHVVIRVKDLDRAVEAYRKILGVEPKRQSSAALKADQAFFYLADGSFVELITPTDESSPVAGSLAKLGEGVHTIAFLVERREDVVRDLQSKEIRVISGGFVHPASAHGVLLQLYEKQ